MFRSKLLCSFVLCITKQKMKTQFHSAFSKQNRLCLHTNIWILRRSPLLISHGNATQLTGSLVTPTPQVEKSLDISEAPINVLQPSNNLPMKGSHCFATNSTGIDYWSWIAPEIHTRAFFWTLVRRQRRRHVRTSNYSSHQREKFRCNQRSCDCSGTGYEIKVTSAAAAAGANRFLRVSVLLPNL